MLQVRDIASITSNHTGGWTCSTSANNLSGGQSVRMEAGKLRPFTSHVTLSLPLYLSLSLCFLYKECED